MSKIKITFPGTVDKITLVSIEGKRLGEFGVNLLNSSRGYARGIGDIGTLELGDKVLVTIEKEIKDG